MSVWQGNTPIPLYTRAADPIFAQGVRKAFFRDKAKRAAPVQSGHTTYPAGSQASPAQATLPPRRPRRWLRWLLELTGAALLFLTAALVTDFIYFVSTLQAEEPNQSVRADGIIALTGGSDRITEAFDLLTEGRAKRLLITGVNKATSEESLSNHAAGGAEILDCCVDIDRNALNTVGNALETARWVHDKQFKSIIVVTSNYHMPRSLLELRRVLPDTTLIAYPVISQSLKLDHWWMDPSSIRLLVSEYVKYAGATFQLRVERPTMQTRGAQAS
jgi:uncharacterized SAM-binding protein YcdF (DUF218 family)